MVIISIQFSGCRSKAEKYFEKGQNLFFKGETKQALLVYEKGLAIDNQNVKLLYGAGWAHLVLGNPKRALTFFGRCIKLEDSYYGGYKGMANLFARLGNFREAEDYFQKALERSPKNSSIYSNLGDVYLFQKKYEDAKNTYEQGLSYSPKYGDLGNGIVSLYLETQKFDEAISYSRDNLKKPFQQKLSQLRAYYLQGKSYLERARFHQGKGDSKRFQEDLDLAKNSLKQGKNQTPPLEFPLYFIELEKEIKSLEQEKPKKTPSKKEI